MYSRTRSRRMTLEKARAATLLDERPDDDDWSKSGLPPPNIPSNPDKTYSDEFISYSDFLGYAPKRGAGGSRDHNQIVITILAQHSQYRTQAEEVDQTREAQAGPSSTTAPNTSSASIPRPSIKVNVEKTVKEEDTNNDDDDYHHDHKPQAHAPLTQYT